MPLIPINLISHVVIRIKGDQSGHNFSGLLSAGPEQMAARELLRAN